MTSPIHFEQTPPRSWDQFEELCADTFAAEWYDPALVRHGRAGQRQYGVDIVARHGSLYPVGLQCKKKSKWPVKRLTTSDVDKEVKKALAFPKLKSFFLLTTAPDDAPVQSHVRQLNERHQNARRFNVVVLGWGEIVRRATLHPAVAAKHFGGASAGPREPLLANWRIEKGHLLLKGKELALSCRELAHEFHNVPSGRIVLRQAESDALAEKLSRYEGRKLTFKERSKKLKLRDQLKRLEKQEVYLATGIRLMLADPLISVYLAEVWGDSGDLQRAVAAFVRRELDPEKGVIKPTHVRLRLFAPNDPEIRRSMYMSPSLGASVRSLMQKRIKKYGRPLTNTVDELPDDVRARVAIPGIMAEILRQLEDGKALDDLRQAKLLDVGRWKIEME
jgi:hypothetical protein